MQVQVQVQQEGQEGQWEQEQGCFSRQYFVGELLVQQLPSDR